MSKGEELLGQLLHELYPHYRILPQHPVKIKRTTLFIDYYIPQLKLAVEYDGRQHEAFVKHFHGSRLDFEDSQYRDRLKEQWCQENGVRLVRVSYRDTLNQEILYERLFN